MSLIADQFKYAEFDGDVHLSCFGEVLFEQNWSRNQDCLFEMKVGAQANLNMLDSPLSDRKYTFQANLDEKIKIA